MHAALQSGPVTATKLHMHEIVNTERNQLSCCRWEWPMNRFVYELKWMS